MIIVSWFDAEWSRQAVIHAKRRNRAWADEQCKTCTVFTLLGPYNTVLFKAIYLSTLLLDKQSYMPKDGTVHELTSNVRHVLYLLYSAHPEIGGYPVSWPCRKHE